MKVGIRKPNIKKRVSARTTGKIKRNIKSTINPIYGKKGMGIINNPEKAIYNKIYNKTTMSVDDLVNIDNDNCNNTNELEYFKINENRIYKKNGNTILVLFISVIGILCLLNSFVIGKFNPVTFISGIACFYFAIRKYIKK